VVELRNDDTLRGTLAAVDACRQRLDGVAAILKRFRQAVLAAATSGELTREWREERGIDDDWMEVQLGKHAQGFSYGTSAKSQSEGEIPVLRMGNIQSVQNAFLKVGGNAEIVKTGDENFLFFTNL
jgi:type I restriction enzyme S subunit